MLRGDAVGLAHHLGFVVADDDFAEIGPGFAGGLRGRQDRQQPLDLPHGIAGELFRIGQQDRRRSRAVLGLAEQIGGADFAVDRVVGDDQRLGRPGEEIDADAAEQLPLGFGDIGIAGPDDHVDRRDGLGAERHGGDRLHAAEHENLVGAAEMHRRDNRRMRPAVKRRRAGDDVLHAGDARGDDRHMRRRHHRIAAARHVAADRIDRNILMAEHDAGHGLDLEVAHRLFLLLREIAHLRLGKLDVVEIALLHLADGAFDLGRRQLERSRRPVVEFLRQVAHRRILARLDIGEDLLDRLAHLGVGFFDRAGVHSALKMPDHGVSPFFFVTVRLVEAPLSWLPPTGSTITAVP